jgi:uncharacterized protein YerC
MCVECFSLAIACMIQPVGAPKIITAEQMAEVLRLRDQGLTYKAISRKTGISKAQCFRIVKMSVQ